MKWFVGKDRTRVSVFSLGGIVGGHAIDTLVDIDIGRNIGICSPPQITLSDPI